MRPEKPQRCPEKLSNSPPKARTSKLKDDGDKNRRKRGDSQLADRERRKGVKRARLMKPF